MGFLVSVLVQSAAERPDSGGAPDLAPLFMLMATDLMCHFNADTAAKDGGKSQGTHNDPPRYHPRPGWVSGARRA